MSTEIVSLQGNLRNNAVALWSYPTALYQTMNDNKLTAKKTKQNEPDKSLVESIIILLLFCHEQLGEREPLLRIGQF